MPDFVDISDFMNSSSTLRRHGSGRCYFDPKDPAHIASMKAYLTTGMWTIQFFCEDPYIDVPMTVLRKYIGHQLGVPVTNQQKLETAPKPKRAKVKKIDPVPVDDALVLEPGRNLEIAND